MSTSPSLVLNQSELAAILGVSTKTVQHWDRAGLREAARLKSSGRSAKYDAPAALRWWRDLEVQKALEPYSSTDLEDERRRLVSAQATRVEIEVAEIRGELIQRDVMRRQLVEVFGSVRARLVAMKGSMPPRFVGMDTAREVSAVFAPAMDEVIAECQAAAIEYAESEISRAASDLA